MGVIKWGVVESSGDVGDAGDTEDGDLEGGGLECFRDGAHADSICSEGSEHADFCGSFIGGAGHHGVGPGVQFE